nr:unnamed protein product [Callosobruchus chinensis]
MMQPVYFSNDNCGISSAYSKCFKYMRKIFRYEQFVKFILFAIAVDCIGLGILVASLFWYITNAIKKPKNNMMDVEWGYYFDINQHLLPFSLH